MKSCLVKLYIVPKFCKEFGDSGTVINTNGKLANKVSTIVSLERGIVSPINRVTRLCKE